MKKYILSEEHELDKLANEILPDILASKNILFYGEMGAGKTTLIKAICAALGYTNDVSSPTYSIVNEYLTDKSLVFHFDLFRLESQAEVLDIGFEDYLERNAICLIEWPQKIDTLIDHGLKIEIEKIDLNTRKFSIFKF